MKVSGIGSATAAGPAAKSVKPAKTGAFADRLASLDQAAEETQGVDAPIALSGIATLLATQGVDDAAERAARRRLVQYGESLLDQLDELRHGLLFGAVPKERLITMAQMVRSRREAVADPRLAALLDEIELRVEVELAKLAPRDS